VFILRRCEHVSVIIHCLAVSCRMSDCNSAEAVSPTKKLSRHCTRCRSDLTTPILACSNKTKHNLRPTYHIAKKTVRKTTVRLEKIFHRQSQHFAFNAHKHVSSYSTASPRNRWIAANYRPFFHSLGTERARVGTPSFRSISLSCRD
jgi:hypothetical protein